MKMSLSMILNKFLFYVDFKILLINTAQVFDDDLVTVSASLRKLENLRERKIAPAKCVKERVILYQPQTPHPHPFPTHTRMRTELISEWEKKMFKRI